MKTKDNSCSRAFPGAWNMAGECESFATDAEPLGHTRRQLRLLGRLDVPAA